MILNMAQSSHQSAEKTVLMPGFGHFEPWYHKHLLDMESRLGLAKSNMTMYSSQMCTVVKLLFEQGITPHGQLSQEELANYCEPFFDEASCVPSAPLGQLSIFPCMSEYQNVPFNTSGKKIYSL